jgi:hypothetical protein
MDKQLKRFAQLFRGLERAYGTYDLTRGKRKGSKVMGQAVTKMERLTSQVWLQHIKGVQGVGVVPIRDDSTCLFGAIDIDVYEGLDVNKILTDIKELDLPVVPCYSKSGGVHCFVFVKEPVTAAEMREKLSVFSAVLGFGDAEIFPKQTEILAERGDIGQWINIPYYEAVSTKRYAMDLDGKQLSLDQFLDYAESRQMTAAEFAAFTVTVLSDISDGPPCLQYLISQGFARGSRNDGMFNVAVYLKKAYPDTWETVLDDYNVKYMDPPLSSSEVQNIDKSLKRRDYSYTCNKPPVKAFCNMALCRTRKYGLDPVAGMPALTGLTKYDTQPPIWFIDIAEGGRLELSTGDIQNQIGFQRRCMDALNVMPPQVGRKQWQVIIQTLLENVTVIEAPADASPRGQLIEHLDSFCTGKAAARDKDELLLGKPWTEDGRHYFRLRDFSAYLEHQRFREIPLNRITAILKDIGGEHHFYNLKGRGVNCWSVPEFGVQLEGFPTPDVKGENVL